MRVTEVQARSILNKSGISRVDYAVNPYLGCAHACAYCYACFMKRFSNHPEPWGTFVDVKVNAPDLLVHQLRGKGPLRVMLSSVTDAYQPLERQYALTRRCLEVLARYPAVTVSILTKSDLVLRDLRVLGRLPDVRVGMTVTAADDEVSHLLEPGAPPASLRWQALRQLGDAGHQTWVMLGPLLPFFSDQDEPITALLRSARAAGVSEILVDDVNFYPSVTQRLRAVYRSHSREAFQYLQKAIVNQSAYADELRERVRYWSSALGIPIAGSFAGSPSESTSPPPVQFLQAEAP